MHPHGSKGSHSALSSMVLDMTDGFQHDSSHKEARFIYRFVRQKSSESRERLPSENTMSTGTPMTDDLDCKLRTGDRVVKNNFLIAPIKLAASDSVLPNLLTICCSPACFSESRRCEI